jgi:hypothetical protein
MENSARRRQRGISGKWRGRRQRVISGKWRVAGRRQRATGRQSPLNFSAASRNLLQGGIKTWVLRQISVCLLSIVLNQLSIVLNLSVIVLNLLSIVSNLSVIVSNPGQLSWIFRSLSWIFCRLSRIFRSLSRINCRLSWIFRSLSRIFRSLFQIYLLLTGLKNGGKWTVNNKQSSANYYGSCQTCVLFTRLCRVGCFFVGSFSLRRPLSY